MRVWPEQHDAVNTTSGDLWEDEIPSAGPHVVSEIAVFRERRRLIAVTVVVFVTALWVLALAVLRATSGSAFTGRFAALTSAPLLAILGGSFGYYFSSREPARLRVAGLPSR